MATPLRHQNLAFESSSTRSRVHHEELIIFINRLTNTPLNHHHPSLCIRKPIISTLSYRFLWILSLRGSLFKFNLPLRTPYDEALAEKGVWITDQHGTRERKKGTIIHVISQIHRQESQVRRSVGRHKKEMDQLRNKQKNKLAGAQLERRASNIVTSNTRPRTRLSVR